MISPLSIGIVASTAAEAVDPVEHFPEITTLDFAGLSGAVLANATDQPGKSFLISSASHRICPWFQVDGETTPDVGGANAFLPLSVGGFDDTAVAEAVRAGLESIDLFIATREGTVVTITDPTNGVREDAVDVNCGVVVTVTQQGS